MTTTEQPRLTTTVDQHRGDHAATGLRITELTDVVTEWPMGDREWNSLTDADREEFAETLADYHAARVELAEQDADTRERAAEILPHTPGYDDFDYAAKAVREAIAAAKS